MRVFRVLLVLCFGVAFSYSKVCEDYYHKLQGYEKNQEKIFKEAHKNATSDELWNIAITECNNDSKPTLSACVYIYKNFLDQEKEVAKKANILNVINNIIRLYMAENNTSLKKADENFVNYKINIATQDAQKILEALHKGGYLTENQFLAQTDLNKVILKLSTFGACPDKYDASKTQPFLPDDKINDACLCLLKQKLLIEDEDYLTATKISELLCKQYKDGGSCLLVGTAYKEGVGVRFDILKAKEYFGLACDYGNQDGCSKYKALSY